MAACPPILVEVSPGELWDKITILRIKNERICDETKRKNVQAELAMLEATDARSLPPCNELDALIERLIDVNGRLWTVEDNIRACERSQDFGPSFIELARSVYRMNDERGQIKRQINVLLGSVIVEEKQYEDYA